MNKVLVILGSPLKEDAISTKVANKFIEEYKKKNADDEIKTIEAYNVKDIQLTKTLLQGKPSAYDLEVAQNRQSLLDDYLAADKIIVASPMWNFGLPGSLKEVLDTFMVAGTTFKYLEAPDAEGNVAVGLTKGKKMLHIAAMGGFNEGKSDLAHQQVEAIFKFTGIKDISYITSVANDVPGMSTEAQAMEKASELAKTF